MAGAQQLVGLLLVQPDRTAGVGADLGVDEVAVRSPVLTPVDRGVEPGLDSHEHGLAVGRARVSLGEDRHQPAQGDLRRQDRAPGVGHETKPVAPRGLQQGPSRLGAEGADGEDGGHAQATGGNGECPEQQPAAGDRPAPLQVFLEVGALLLGFGQDVALLGERPLGHQAVRPRHQPVGQAAEGRGQQRPLGLGLAAPPVHDGEADAGGAAEEERQGGRALGEALEARSVPSLHFLSPIQRMVKSRATMPMAQATKPSANGPRCHSGFPPLSSGWSR